MIRIDLVNVNFGTIPTGFGGNADTVPTINGISSQRSQDAGSPLIVGEVSLEMILLCVVLNARRDGSRGKVVRE